ncbi:helix-turn-helix domain-containing protein [Enterocloster asparagiformis]|uniref:helix-turn-helix domain-containing protein n=1 Tax=Enterocloster asparagiformis TaxID=333367 RepID=UPI0002EA76B5|nr:LysR family transcriptional regulator [Enterocloster asparagiformis]
MKTSDWALIQTLYECRNITRAAAQLYISQPTLTKRLRAIEEELGVVIALRGKRGVTFTPEGEYLAVKATQFLSLMDEVNRHLTELKEGALGHPLHRCLQLHGPLLPARIAAILSGIPPGDQL